MCSQFLQSFITKLLELLILQLFKLNCFLDLVIAMNIFIIATEVHITQPNHDWVPFEPHVSQCPLKHSRQVHDFHWSVYLLFRDEFIHVKFGVLVGELAFFQSVDQLVISHFIM